MKIGEPTVSWPTETDKLYIHAMYHTFFWGPYDSIDDVKAATERMTAIDSYWNYDCYAVYRGSSQIKKDLATLESVPRNF